MDLDLLTSAVGWPLMLLAAWLAGEWLFRRWQVPRVAAYAAVGLALGGLGASRVGAHGTAGYLANVGLALALFELGYRVNPRWFRHNPWVLAAGLGQALLVFLAVRWIAAGFGLAPEVGLVLAALCVATSPAAILRVTHELHSSGQVTERLLHLCALNCLIAALIVKLVVGYWHLETSGDLARAAFDSIYVIGLSLVVGAAFGVLTPLLNRVATTGQSTTVTFALAVLLMTGVAEALQISSLLAALAFGAMARERRTVLSHAQRNFGALGDVLVVFLFVFVGSLLTWGGLGAGLLLALAVLLARSAVHVVVNLGVAHGSGTTWRKGALTGLALMPMSSFALLLLEESRVRGFGGVDSSLPVYAALLVLLEVAGPLVTQRSLMWAGEARPEET